MAWVGEHGYQQAPKPYPIRILASCVSGSLQASQNYKDFGSVIVGSSVTSELTLINNNDCALDFELFIRQTTDESLSCKKLDDLCVLEFVDMSAVATSSSGGSTDGSSPVGAAADEIKTPRLNSVRGHIEARSKLNVRCRLRPTRLINYQFTIEYRILYKDSEKKLTSNDRREVLCYMTGVGVYPKFNVSDIKALGSAANLNKDFLWRLLSINE